MLDRGQRRTGRRGLVAVALATLLLGQVLLSGPPSEAAGVEPLAHLRITVTSSSDWATATLHGITERAARVVSEAPGTRLHRSHGSITVLGSGHAAATVDVLAEVTGTPRLTLDKGWDGDAVVEVQRRTDGAVVASLANDRQVGDRQPVETTIDPAELVGTGVEAPLVDPRPLTLAFYYPWWPKGSVNDLRIGDRPSSAWQTDDPASVATMVDEARVAGIDGFVVSWGGEAADGAELDLVLDVAEQRGDFQVATLLELPQHTTAGLLGPRIDVGAALQSARQALARSTSPAQLRVGDRPVLAVYGLDRLSDAQRAELLGALRAAGAFVIGDSSELAGLDGVYLYDPTRPSTEELGVWYRRLHRRTHLDPILDPAIPTRLFAATVAPGKAASVRAPLDGRPRQGGQRYDRIWSTAVAATPEWVLITSWNEWYEATHIAPSQQHGRLALDQTRAWSQRFTTARAA